MIVFALGSTRVIAATATYREQNALQPNTIFEAVLEDSSSSDGIVKRVGEFRAENPKFPIYFVIPYDPSQIRKGHAYAVRATIKHDNHSLFATKSLYPVLKQPDDVGVDMYLSRTGPSVSDVQPEC